MSVTALLYTTCSYCKSLAFSYLVLLTVVACNIIAFTVIVLAYLACHFCDVTKDKLMLM